MPYLRLTAPALNTRRRQLLAEELTEAVVELFSRARGPRRAELRARTTVHFIAHGPNELFVGGSRWTRMCRT